MSNNGENFCLSQQEMDKLSSYWYRLGKKGVQKNFGSYAKFLQWAIDHGYSDGMWLIPIDPGKPIGPNNAEWRYKSDIVGNPEVKVPTEHPCEKCTRKEECREICYTRAKWWDVQMAKVRKRLGL